MTGRPNICTRCDDGFYQAVDTTMCHQSCPAGYIQYDDAEICGLPCKPGQYVRDHDKVCRNCSLDIEGCDKCFYDTFINDNDHI